MAPLSLALLVSLATNRHICLLDSYNAVKGPHFNGLFDQIVEETGFETKRVAFVTTTDTSSSAEATCRAELDRLHRFVVAWMTGQVEESADLLQHEFSSRLSSDFQLINPSGQLVSKDLLTTSLLESGYESRSRQSFEIYVENFQLLQRMTEELVLVVYDEWQRLDTESTARRVTAILELGDRVKWRHVHETWLQGHAPTSAAAIFKPTHEQSAGKDDSRTHDDDDTGFETNRVDFVTTAGNDSHTQHEDLVTDLGIDSFETILLDQETPLTLEKRLKAMQPTVYWAFGTSALTLRHYMRTSGFDGIVQDLCDVSRGSSVLFVGEGRGSISAGSHMKLAPADDAAAPEPQFRGLDLLGPETSVCFDDVHERLKDLDGKIRMLDKNQVYVWSQCDGSATEFVMNPRDKGSIGCYANHEPLPPLRTDIGGRPCVGEPAVDPSRMLQTEGDSEWFEGEV